MTLQHSVVRLSLCIYAYVMAAHDPVTQIKHLGQEGKSLRIAGNSLINSEDEQG